MSDYWAQREDYSLGGVDQQGGEPYSYGYTPAPLYPPDPQPAWPVAEYAIPPADGRSYDPEAMYPMSVQPYPFQQTPMYASMANGTATTALVLGIVSITVAGLVTGIPAIILGVQGRRAAREGRATNEGVATAGMILGIISTVLSLIAFLAFFAFLIIV